MNQNDIIDINSDVNKLHVYLLDWVHSICGILTSDLEKNIIK